MDKFYFAELSDADYHADRTAVSKSWLDQIERSPAHLYHYLYQREEKEPSDALKEGSLIHSMILENDISGYAVVPKFDRRTKEGKAGYAEWLEKNAGKVAVSEAIMQNAVGMRERVRSHKIAGQFFKEGKPEVTVFYEDLETGILCKARFDWYIPSLNWVVDLKKSAKDVSMINAAKTIAQYRYHVQAAHYTLATNAPKFFFVFVEKTPPYEVAVYDADELINPGLYDRTSNLLAYKRCIETGEFPGYPEEVQKIRLPGSYFNSAGRQASVI